MQQLNPVEQTFNHNQVSTRYRHVTTQDIITRMELDGFKLHGIHNSSVRRKDFDGYQKHVAFLNAEWLRTEEGVPQIALFNDHRGRMSVTLYGGFFRHVCCNIQQWANNHCPVIRIKHAGNVYEELNHVLPTLRDWMERVVLTVDQWKAVQTTNAQQVELVHSVAQRMLKDVQHDFIVDCESLLNARRVLDNGSDAWRVMQRVQENALDGQIVYRTKRKKALYRGGPRELLPVNQRGRKIKAIDAKREMNQFIFEESERLLLGA